MTTRRYNTTAQATAGFPFLAILGLIFITLKLTGYIAWSWWWVLAPLWVGPLILLIVLGCIGVFLLIAFMVSAMKPRSGW